MTPTEVHSAIHALLVERGDRATAEAQERYMKGVVRFHGLKTPALRALVKEHATLWKTMTPAEKIELGWLLLRSPWFEEKDWGISILKTVKTLDNAWLARLEGEFDGVVNGWATCDGLCGSVLRPMLARQELRRRIVSWKGASSPWLQRAAAVAFVNDAKTGKYNRRDPRRLRDALEKHPVDERAALTAL